MGWDRGGKGGWGVRKRKRKRRVRVRRRRGQNREFIGWVRVTEKKLNERKRVVG